MQSKLMTESEWRKKVSHTASKHPGWWGAQCVYPAVRRRRVTHDRSFHRFILILSVISALLLPTLCQTSPRETFAEKKVEETEERQVRVVSAISYAVPEGISTQNCTFTRSELLRGRMLLLDGLHHLPTDVPPPNTASVAKYGKGMVPVRAFSIKTGEETIDALRMLFSQMKAEGMEGIYVWQGAVTRAQLRRNQIENLRGMMKHYPPEQAVRMVNEIDDADGGGELLQEYTVELCQLDAVTQLPLETPLEDTPQGQRLLQLAWRYGFIRSSREHPYRFRYVGKAHAMAMTYLDLELKDYLEWMHQKKCMVISAGGKPQYLILCQPMNGSYAAMELPANCEYEVSLDNTGYVLAACTL